MMSEFLTPSYLHLPPWASQVKVKVAQLCPAFCYPMDYIVHQAPLSMGFFRLEYWSGLPFPSQGIFPTQGANPGLLHCRQILHHLSHQGSPGGLLVKNLPVVQKVVGSIPELGRSPGEGSDTPAQYSCLGSPVDRGACGLQSMGWQRVRHDLVTKQQQFTSVGINFINWTTVLPCRLFLVL